MAAYQGERNISIFISLIAAGSWTITNILAGKTYSYFLIPYWNFTIRSCLFISFALLTSKFKHTLEREKYLARIDFITGVSNNQSFFEVANMEIQRSKRYKRPLSLAYIDCDNFKDINDSFGHREGNRLLALIANTIQKNIRIIDVVARLGGDEFVVLLPESAYEAVQKVLQRINSQLLITVKENGYNVTFSIGVAIFLTAPFTVDELVEKADNLMYSAKRKGKNRIVYGMFREESSVNTEQEEIVDDETKKP